MLMALALIRLDASPSAQPGMRRATARPTARTVRAGAATSPAAVPISI